MDEKGYVIVVCRLSFQSFQPLYPSTSHCMLHILSAQQPRLENLTVDISNVLLDVRIPSVRKTDGLDYIVLSLAVQISTVGRIESRDMSIGIAFRLQAGRQMSRRRVRLSAGARYFLFLIMSKPTLGPTQTSLQ
jgi:hypothetical protein